MKRGKSELGLSMPGKASFLIIAFCFVIVLTCSFSDASTAISSCTALDTDGEDYQLSQSIGSSGTCLNISADHIVVDCQNNWINYSGEHTFGINNSGGFDNITIKNCFINHTNSTPTGGFGIFMNYSDNSIIEYNNITNGKVGILIMNSFNATVQHNYGSRFFYGESSAWTTCYPFNSTSPYKYYESGIWLVESHNSTIFNNTIYGYETEAGVTNHGGTEAGISLCKSNYSNITQNYLNYADTFGFNLAQSHYNDLFYNIVNCSNLTGAANTNDGIIFGGASGNVDEGPCNYNNFSHNKVYNGSEWGIFTSNSDFNMIYNNTVYQGEVGIRIGGDSDNNKILKNTGEENQIGIRVEGKDNQIDENNLIDSYGSAISVLTYSSGETSHNMVLNNILNLSQNGIYIIKGGTLFPINNSISNNSISNARVGVSMTNSKNNSFYENNFIHNVTYAFYLITSNGNFFYDDTINTSNYSFYIDRSDRNTFRETMKSEEYGIYIINSTKNIFFDSNLTSTLFDFSFLTSTSTAYANFTNVTYIKEKTNISEFCDGTALICDLFIEDEEGCLDQDGCTWEEPVCLGEPLPCSSFTDGSGCTGQDGCSWGTGTLNVQWYVDIFTNYTNGSIAPGATVRAYDINNVLRNTEMTESNAYTRLNMSEFYVNSTNTYYLTNYSLNATINPISSTESKNFTGNLLKEDNNQIVLTIDNTNPVASLTFTPTTVRPTEPVTVNCSGTDTGGSLLANVTAVSSDGTSICSNLTCSGNTCSCQGTYSPATIETKTLTCSVTDNSVNINNATGNLEVILGGGGQGGGGGGGNNGGKGDDSQMITNENEAVPEEKTEEEQKQEKGGISKTLERISASWISWVIVGIIFLIILYMGYGIVKKNRKRIKWKKKKFRFLPYSRK